MKKALALVLALVLALSLGVSAFALNVVDLEYVPATPASKTPVTNTLVKDKIDTEGVTYLAPAKGGDFYFEIEDYADLKNLSVTTAGSVSAEVVKFDGSKMTMDGVYFFVVDTKGAVKDPSAPWAGEADINYYLENSGKLVAGTDFTSATGADWTKYETAAKYAKLMNNVAKVSSRFVVKAYKAGGVEVELNLLKVTVAPNYSASYKEGSFKLTAVSKSTGLPVSYSATVISDVTIFEYEEVKWAAKQGYLTIGVKGYSDYETSKLGYGKDYDAEDIRTKDNATVVSTTAFRAIVGEDLVVAADDNNYITIYDVAKGQKGVNFAYHDYEFYDAKGKKITDGSEVGNTVEVKFGFLGNQVIASDFEIVVEPGMSYYDLRELFGEKVEEEDIITYYILKDGKKYGEFTVDYLDTELAFSAVELVIEGKAGDTLGEYSVVLNVPSEAPEGEENPNTGAESVIGVVAAMAVVSVAAAAAVSLKK